MKKIIMLLLFCWLLTACSTQESPQPPQTPEPVPKIEQEQVVKDNNKFEQEEEEEEEINPSLFEFRAPDNNSWIKMDVNPMEIAEGIPYKFKIYVQEKLVKELTVWDVTEDPVVWLDNQRAVIGGRWIYNTTTNSTDYIWSEKKYIFTYKYSPDKQLLAVCQKTDYQERTDILGFEILVVNLNNMQIKQVYTFPGSKTWTSGILFNISWLDNNTFFFDGNQEEVPTIFRYSLKEDKVENYLSQAWGPAAAPKGEFISYIPLPDYYYKDNNEELIIRNLVTQKEGTIPGFQRTIWVNENTMLATSWDKGTVVYKVRDDLALAEITAFEEPIMEIIYAKPKGQYYQIGYLYWKDGQLKSKVRKIGENNNSN